MGLVETGDVARSPAGVYHKRPMFPSRVQQVALAICLALLVWLSGLLVGEPGHNGGLLLLELSFTQSVGLVIWMVLALALGLLVNATGNAMAGGAVVSAAILVMAANGGSIQWWLRVHSDPGRYVGLAIEAALWALPYVGLVLLTRYARRHVRRFLPAILRTPHFAEVAEEEQSPPLQSVYAGAPVLLSVAAVAAAQKSLWVDYIACLTIGMGLLLVLWVVCMFGQNLIDHGKAGLQWRAPMASSFLGSVVAMAVGSATAVVLIRSVDSGQVIGALLVAFTLGGLVGHQMFPSPTRLTYVLVPLLLCMASYGWVAASVSDSEQLLRKLFVTAEHGGVSPLFPLALSLPSQYASAGVLGTLLGVGWSQSLYASQQRHVTLVTN